MMPEESEVFEISKQVGNERHPVSDRVAGEEPLQITVDGTPVAVVMRTPGDDGDLVRGFLLTEGLVSSLDDVIRVDLEAKQNHALVFLADDVVLDQERLSRNLYSASSCGICGKASIEAIQQNAPPIENDFTVSTATVLALPDALRASPTARAAGTTAQPG